MKPWYHYIPVSNSMEETEKLLDFFKRHDDLAMRIAGNGFDFIDKNLTFDEIKCYWKELLLKYKEMTNFDLPPLMTKKTLIGKAVLNEL